MIFKYLIIEFPIYEARDSDLACLVSQRTFNVHGRRHIEFINPFGIGIPLKLFAVKFKSHIYALTYFRILYLLRGLSVLYAGDESVGRYTAKIR
jgi:hypothetical protein